MSIFYSETTKGFYDNSIWHKNLPNDAIEVTDEQYKNLIFDISTNEKEIVVINGVVTTQDIIYTPTWRAIRLIRKGKLTKSDYTQMPDYPGDKIAWATYRQALRDLPQTYSKPEDVIWPTPPQ